VSRLTDGPKTDGRETDEVAAVPKPRSFLRRRLGKIGLVTLLLYSGWCVLLLFTQHWLIFPEYTLSPPGPEEKYDDSTVVLTREIDDGGVIAWFVPAPGADAAHPAPLVVYIHGAGNIIDTQGHRIEGYHRLGCSVLLPEYRGYGRCDGTPSEAAIVDDVLHFYDAVIQRPEVDRTRVVVHGRSMGGAIAATLAERRGADALILGSSFTNLSEVASDLLWIPRFVVRASFQLDQILTRLDIPTLIFHGTEDAIVPHAHGDRLLAIAKSGRLVKIKCGHRGFPCEAEAARYWREIEAFLRESGTIGP
jgi:pimeloyl-ACP methyl ester carboxylesterase